MDWECSNCGFAGVGGDETRCPACGAVRMPRRIVLTGAAGKRLDLGITTSLGRRVLADVAGEDAQYASDPQFEILRDDEGGRWLIRHLESAANPTWYDGELLGSEPRPIEQDTVVSIGPDNMKLRIRFEY